MKITLTSTNEFVEIDGVRCKMWDGETESGIPIQAAIGRIAPREDSVLERAMNIHDFGTEEGLSLIERFSREARQNGFIPPSELTHQSIRDVK